MEKEKKYKKRKYIYIVYRKIFNISTFVVLY